MIDNLTVLKGELKTEGFFKLEDGYKKMTCGVTVGDARARNYKLLWVAETSKGGFIDGVARLASPLDEKPENIGFFLLDGDKAYPLATVGTPIPAGYTPGNINEFINSLEAKNKKTEANAAAPGQASATSPVTAVTPDSASSAPLSENALSAASATVTSHSPASEATAFSTSKFSVEAAPASANAHDAVSAPASVSSAKSVPVNASEAENSKSTLRNRLKEPQTFFDCNQEDFEAFLKTNPRVKIMEALIPGSEWAKGEDYILGIIYDEESKPLYLCYGFTLPWSEQPPERLGNYCQWIPTDCARPHDEGYWVVYINASTGERIR